MQSFHIYIYSYLCEYIYTFVYVCININIYIYICAFSGPNKIGPPLHSKTSFAHPKDKKTITMRWQAANPYPICFICSSMAFRVFWRACKLNIYIYIFISIHINAHPGVATPIHIYTGIYIYICPIFQRTPACLQKNQYVYIYIYIFAFYFFRLGTYAHLVSWPKPKIQKKNDEWPSLEIGKPSRCFCLWNTRWHP